MFSTANKIFHFIRKLPVRRLCQDACKNDAPPSDFPPSAILWLEEMCEFLMPSCMHILDGSSDEKVYIADEVLNSGAAIKLKEEDGCLYVRSHECDDRRDPKCVFTASCDTSKFIPETACNSKYGPLLGNRMSVPDANDIINSRFHRCMKGKKMYVIPFMLGPKDAEKKLFGIQLTDSSLAALITSMIARVGHEAQAEMIKASDCKNVLIKLIHSTGNNPCAPPNWPHDKDNYIVINLPDKKSIYSYGSSHWDNSVLVKDSAALQLSQYILNKESKIMPLNMSVLSVEKVQGKARYIGIMGGPGSGKSVFASLNGETKICPLNGKMVIDDVAWIQNDCKLMAINPLVGFMPLVRGVNETNTPKLYPLATSRSILLNTALSAKDSAWWEGKSLPDKDDLKMTDWMGNKWRKDGPRAAHIDSRFVNTWKNMENIDSRWENGYGVPLDAIIILSRRNKGHPLIMELESWTQAVYHMATIRTRYHSTGIDSDEVHWEPFGRRNFLGLNLGKVIEDWMSFSIMDGSFKPSLPRTFIANLFLMDPWAKEHMWPGYEENATLIHWVLSRLDCEAGGEKTPMGILPKEEDFPLPDNMQYTLKSVSTYDPDYWMCEFNQIEDLIMDQLPNDVPELFCKEFFALKNKVIEEEEKKKRTC